MPDRITAVQTGLNCVALAHLVLKDLFDRQLPTSLHCYEMVIDELYFQTLSMDSEMQAGDLVWLGLENPAISLADFMPEYDEGNNLLNWRANPVKHVAIYTGQRINDDLMMLHASQMNNSNTIWPLRQFSRYRRYKKIYRISRLILSELIV